MTYGAGSITFERGRYRLRVPDGKGKHRSVGTFPTLEQAEQVRDALVLEGAALKLGGAQLLPYGEMVIGRWARAGLRDLKSTRSRWSAIVGRAPFAHTSIALITRPEIRDWLRALPLQLGARGKPLSWQTQKHALGLLCRVLDEAIEDGLIKVNPARGLRLQRRQERAEGWTWLTLDELAAVFALELTAEQRAALAIAVYQGLRQGEIAALTWEHVDLAGGWLVVAGSWDTATKSGRVRRIPLLPDAAAALLAWRPLQSERTGLVFPRAPGERYARGYDWGWGDRRVGPDIPTRAGIKRRVRFHDLRHTCAAHLVSGSWGKTWRLRAVRDFLGHTSEAVTERYAHLAPDALHALAQGTTSAQQPAANLPHEVRAAALQVLDFVRRAVRDSNARPLAPEPRGSRAAARTSESARQVSGRSLAKALTEAAAAGRTVEQTELDALAAAVLTEPRALRALQALAADEHALRAALELADRVIGVRERSPAAQPKKSKRLRGVA